MYLSMHNEFLFYKKKAFQSLQSALPAVPPSTKLSKLDVLLMASAYIAQLGRLLEEESPAFFLDQQSQQTVIFHPVKVGLYWQYLRKYSE